MIMTRRAFLLMEMVVYLGLLAFFTLLVFSFYARLYVGAVRQVQVGQTAVRELTAVDVMKRDLMSASMHSEDWDLKNNVFVVLTVDDRGYPGKQSVGYTGAQQGLMRNEGTYDFGRQVWVDRTACLLATSVGAVTFSLLGGQDGAPVAGVTVSYQVDRGGKPRQENFFVALRNRVLS
jgi:hypothetical protein